MMQIVPLKFTHESKAYTGMAVPALDSCGKDFCQELDVTLNKKHSPDPFYKEWMEIAQTNNTEIHDCDWKRDRGVVSG
jgi:hypothetical protein